MASLKDYPESRRFVEQTDIASQQFKPDEPKVSWPIKCTGNKGQMDLQAKVVQLI